MITVKVGGAVQKYKNILMFNVKNRSLIDGLQMIYYDMPNSCIWNGGRINRNIELTQNIIDTYNQQKFGLDLEFDNYPPSKEDIKFTHASVSKLKSMGFTVPDTTLEDGIQKTYDWLVGPNSQIAVNAILELNN